MTHTATHIIISSLTTPVKAGGKLKVWHYVAAAVLLAFLIGYWLG